MQERMPGEQVAIGASVYKSVCSPNANIPAVNYRAAMLQMVRSFQQQEVGELPDVVQQPIVELPDAVFEVTATFPMRRMPAGVPQQGLPFDAEEFAKQIEQAGRKLNES